MPLHAALRAGASARVLLALIAAYPAAAGSRAQPVQERSLGPKVALGPRVGAGALPLLLALRAGADVEVIRALIEANPGALREYYGTTSRRRPHPDSYWEYHPDWWHWWQFDTQSDSDSDSDIYSYNDREVYDSDGVCHSAPHGYRFHRTELVRFCDAEVRGLPLHEAVLHSAPLAVVELLVDAEPGALLATSFERRLRGWSRYSEYSDESSYVFGIAEFGGTPLALAEELAYEHAQGRGPPVNLRVLALLRARSRALGHTVQLPAERERARRAKAREWELRKAHWRWLRRCLDAGPLDDPLDDRGDARPAVHSSHDYVDTRCGKRLRAVHRRAQMQGAQRRAERCARPRRQERPRHARRGQPGRKDAALELARGLAELA